MEDVIQRNEWHALCDRMRQYGLRETMKECRNIVRINGTWYLDGCSEDAWSYRHLFPKVKLEDCQGIQAYPVGPTAR